MGYEHLKGITVVGDPVNTASRLEQMAKQFDAVVVVSEQAARLGGMETSGVETHEVDVRGREQRMTVHVTG
jgi:adenylate cyclase